MKMISIILLALMIVTYVTCGILYCIAKYADHIEKLIKGDDEEDIS